MDLTEEILTSRYMFFEETQSPKSFKDYKYIYEQSNNYFESQMLALYKVLQLPLPK